MRTSSTLPLLASSDFRPLALTRPILPGDVAIGRRSIGGICAAGRLLDYETLVRPQARKNPSDLCLGNPLCHSSVRRIQATHSPTGEKLPTQLTRFRKAMRNLFFHRADSVAKDGMGAKRNAEA